MFRRRIVVLLVLLLTFAWLPTPGGNPSSGARAQEATVEADGGAPPAEGATQPEDEGGDPATEPAASPADPTAEPTPTETPPEPATEPAAPSETATATEPTAAPGTEPAGTPDAVATEDPGATPAIDAAVSAAALDDIVVSLNCRGNPELTRIDNLGAEGITIISIASLLDRRGDEPFTVDRPLGPGRTVIYRSGSGATYGTVLTTSFLYTNTAYETEGVEVVTSVGTVAASCPPRPAPKPRPKPSKLSLSVTCNSNPEKITVKNIGEGPVTLASLRTTYGPTGLEPFALSQALAPGESITYQSGSAASTNKLTRQHILDEFAGTAEEVVVKVSTGKAFTKSCPPGERWIEVNLSTQYLTAWEGYTRVNGTYVSTGRPGFDTPTGTFYINTKLVSQTMSGCIQGECYYVPDVPYVMYFTWVGHALHGTYWHNNFGQVMSHGCVNLPVWFSEWLYSWASIGTRVVIHY